MDAKDYQILELLINNCRTPLTQLAKKVSLSKENVFQRIKRMENKKIIKEYIINLDLDALDFVHHVCFLQVTNRNEREVIEFLKSTPNFGWIGTHTGKYSIVFDIITKTISEAENLLLKIYDHQSNNLGDYLMLQVNNKSKLKNKTKIDYKILSLLNDNPKITYAQIHKKTGLSVPTIKDRLMELDKVIKKYTINYDYKIYHNQWHGLQIKIKKLSTETEKILENYFDQNPNMIYHYKYYKNGIYDYDVGVLVKDDKQLKNILDELKHKYHELMDIKNSFLILEEVTSEKIPPAVFIEA